MLFCFICLAPERHINQGAVMNKKSDFNSEEHGSHSEGAQIDSQIDGFVISSKRSAKKMASLFREGKWLELLLYSVGLIVLLFAPGAGIFYNLFIKKIVENSRFVTWNLYTSIFISILFFIFLTCLILSMLETIKRSRKSIKLVLSLSIVILIIFVSKFSF